MILSHTLDITEIIGDKSNTLLHVLRKIFLRTYDTLYKVEDNFFIWGVVIIFGGLQKRLRRNFHDLRCPPLIILLRDVRNQYDL